MGVTYGSFFHWNDFFSYWNEEHEYSKTNNFVISSNEVNVGDSFFVQDIKHDDDSSKNNLCHSIDEIDDGDH